ncbi:MAG: PIG-L deacetylase family protein [Phycisphaerae bacterium]
MKILVFSAHPDDAETGAGGLIARAAKAGHEVLIVHFGTAVRGRKINGIPESEIRQREARAAADILGAAVDFFEYGMSEYPATIQSRQRFEDYVKIKKPDVVLTQWPVDTHPDHQAAGILPLRAYVWHQDFCLAFYEVCTGLQTLAFQPNRYVDISKFLQIKRNGIFAHKSQSLQYAVDMHEKMSLFRGLEIGVPHAEAFHVLGGQTKTPFDNLFNDKIIFHDSGGKSLPQEDAAK